MTRKKGDLAKDRSLMLFYKVRDEIRASAKLAEDEAWNTYLSEVEAIDLELKRRGETK